jgi:hypothetical protein
MKVSKKATVFTVTAAVSAGLAVSLAGAASASSHTPAPHGHGAGSSNCANGIYAGYCGTQESATGLYVAIGRNDQVIGTRNPQPPADGRQTPAPPLEEPASAL